MPFINTSSPVICGTFTFIYVQNVLICVVKGCEGNRFIDGNESQTQCLLPSRPTFIVGHARAIYCSCKYCVYTNADLCLRILFIWVHLQLIFLALWQVYRRFVLTFHTVWCGFVATYLRSSAFVYTLYLQEQYIALARPTIKVGREGNKHCVWDSFPSINLLPSILLLHKWVRFGHI